MVNKMYYNYKPNMHKFYSHNSAVTWQIQNVCLWLTYYTPAINSHNSNKSCVTL